MSNTDNLKCRFLAVVGYALSANESPAMAFDRLRVESPDLFPVPRETESFWDAVAEVVARSEAVLTKAELPYSVTLWGSNPDETDTDNDDCWTGDDYATREEALAAYREVVMFPDCPFGRVGNADFEFVMLDGPDVHDVTANCDQPSQARRRRDLAQSDREWQRERAMQAGMAFGCDGYNDERGC